MIDSVVFWGDEARVKERIEEMFSFGASEVLLSPMGAGPNPGESVHRATSLIADLSRAGIGRWQVVVLQEFLCMYSRILTPLDGSSLSEQVLPYVRQLAFGLTAPVTLITVVEPVTPTVGRSLNPEAHEYESDTHLEDHAASYLNGVVSGTPGGEAGGLYGHAVGERRPRKSSPRRSGYTGTLIAMSGHGRAGSGPVVAGQRGRPRAAPDHKPAAHRAVRRRQAFQVMLRALEGSSAGSCYPWTARP